MKLLSKFFAVLVVLSVVVSGIPVNAASRDTVKGAYRLEQLGFLDAGDVNANQAQMSKAVFVKTAVRMYLSGNAAPHYTEVDFQDVNPGGFASNEIQFALKAGLIEQAENFYPESAIAYDEAIKIIVKVLGYGIVAEEEGYAGAALKAKVLKGVDATFGLKDALKLLDNALDSPLMKPKTYGDKYTVSVDKDSTLLNQAGFVVKKVDITKVDVLDGRIEADGETYRTENVDLGTIPEGQAEIYVREKDDLVIYIDVLGDTKIVYDFIEYVNNEQSDKDIYAADIKKISLRNSGETFHVEDDAKITLNEENAYGNYINTFAKIITKDNKIAKVEAYSLRDGGLLYRADPKKIKFISAEMDENVISGFEEVEELEIYVDGVRSSNLLDLKADMVFDYWCNEDESKFIIVASSRTAKGKFDSFDSNSIRVDGVKYELSAEQKLIAQSYVSKKYSAREDYTNLLGKAVEIFVDDNKHVRFIKADESLAEMNEFYGVVLGVGSKTVFDSEYEVKVHKITGNTGEAVYKVASKLEAGSLGMADVASVVKNYDGLGFLKFTLNGKDEIKKIERPEYWGFTRTVSRIEGNANIVGMSLKKATMFALMEIDGQFTVKHVSPNSLTNTRTMPGYEMTMVSDFDIRYNPAPRFIALTKNSDKICNYYTTISTIESVDTLTDDKVRLNFTGGLSYVATKEFAEKHGLTKRCLVRFLDKTLGEDPFYCDSVFDLSGDPQDWQTSSYAPGRNRTLMKADTIRYRDENVIQFETDGEPTEVYLLNDGCPVYEFNTRTEKFERRSREDLSKGYPVWYYVTEWSPVGIERIYYVNTGMAPSTDD